MGTCYHQLSLTERCELYRLHADGIARREIARQLGRSPATISRELRRNSQPSRRWPGGYQPERASELTQRRRARGRPYKLEQSAALRRQVLRGLRRGWSPEQLVGRWRRRLGRSLISHESIYRYIAWRGRNFGETLHRLLPRHHHRRGWRSRTPRWSKNAIFHRVPIHSRPAEVARRDSPGHWEADLMSFSQPGQHLLVAHERHSRRTVLRRQPDKTPRQVLRTLSALYRRLPPPLRRSCTFDNGIEFSHHHLLAQRFGLDTWFCDTHSPWQKGGVENAIGRLRRQLPRNTNLAALSDHDLARMTRHFNSIPRKCLGFQTPDEVFFSKGVALQT